MKSVHRSTLLRWFTALVVVVPLLGYGVKTMAAAQAKAQNPHGTFKEDCSMRHSPSTWKISKVASRFDHSKFGFPLSGAHATSNCMTCHTSLDFAQSKCQCISCHQDPHRGEMGTDCSHCHSARSFTDRGPMVRAHQLTKFPLTGSHATIECEGCHKPSAQGHLQFVGTQADCKGCHMAQYNSAKDPDHAGGGFPTDCQGCHSPNSWNGAKFNHNATRFPLTGAHATTACVSCHAGGSFKAVSMDCYSCHASNYSAAQPPHNATSFPTAQCATCHTTTAWNTTFNHSTTSFPLTGSHQTVACGSCHGDGVFKGKTHDCYTCHTNTYSTATPTHTTAAFPTGQCASCHNTTAWNPGVVNHNAFPFKLTGAHASATCVNCHGDGVYAAKSQACYDCHTANYTSATPTHTPSGFPTSACSTCHNTTQWSGAVFNHNTTAFPLTGSHQSAACAGCHGDGVYKGKTHDCYTCHTATYSTATPTHTTAAFPTSQCASCHNTTAWNPGVVNHNAFPFKLTGAHASATCVQCHGDGVYAAKSQVCYDCHTANYTGATPAHTSASFPPSQCATCHSTTAFSPATFNHSTTAFPLTGSHVSASCAGCHGDGVYKGKTHDCYTCHTATYNAATPAHTPTSFPTSACATCHNTTQWSGASFNHSTTAFPLTGAHQAAACTDCHGDGVYKGKTHDCYTCHTTTYNTASPKHDASAFPTAQCATCHTTTSWNPGVVNHNAFPFKLTGAHASATCTQCHGDGVYAAKTQVCYNCHTTDYNTAQPTHTATGFPSSACSTCHTTVTFSGATFNHSTTAFPLTGAHTTAACSGCHGDGVYKGKTTACSGCHMTDFNTASPNHSAAGFAASACATCHTTTSFSGYKWTAHDNSYFPIYSSTHNGKWSNDCSSCHANANNFAVYSCAQSCHTSQLRNHPNKNGFNLATVETQCYVCHRSGRAG